MTVLFFINHNFIQKQLMILRNSVVVLFVLVFTACGGGVVGNNTNFVVVQDQTVKFLNKIVIESAVVDQNAIIVVYGAKAEVAIESPDNQVVLGYVAIKAGEYTAIQIQLSRNTQNNETLYVELRSDNGVVGVLEADTIDSVVSQATVSTVSFAVIHAQVHIEVVESANSPGQYIAPNPERIDIKEVILNGASWLVVRRNNEGVPGDIMGIQSLSGGYYSKVSISLNPKSRMSDGDQIYIIVYQDVSEDIDDNFDENEDLPVRLNGKIVQLSLEIML